MRPLMNTAGDCCAASVRRVPAVRAVHHHSHGHGHGHAPPPAAAAASYVSGAGPAPLLGLTLGGALARAAREWPDRPALTSRAHETAWSFAELDARADELAAGLLATGLVPGDRVGIWSPNRPEWVVAMFATARAGLVSVALNPAYRPPELEFALRKVGCAGLITATSFKTSDYVGILREVAPELDACAPGALRAARLPDLRVVVQLGGGRAARGAIAYADACRAGGADGAARVAAATAAADFDDVVALQFTSGTTGRPKAVMLTHHGLVNNGAAVGAAQRLGPADAVAIPVPLFHCFGSVLGVLATVTSGACAVLPGEGFDAGATLAAVARERCTALYGVPTMFVAELAHAAFDTFDLRSLRTGIMSGAPCPIELARALVDRMHLRDLTIAYGMTETSPVSFQSTPDDPLERRVTTVGRVLPHVEAKVVDAAGRVVPRGVAGELCTRGFGVMRGYWGEPEQTAAAIDAAGWMHTGDLATIDADGYGNIVGRLKDMVVRGGENVYPREVEEHLLTHPAVLDAQVFGVADDRYGEELCAWVRVRDGGGHAAAGCVTPDAVRAHCVGRIRHQLVPRYVEIVDAFPLTASGKPQKHVMRADVEARLGLKAQRTA